MRSGTVGQEGIIKLQNCVLSYSNIIRKFFPHRTTEIDSPKSHTFMWHILAHGILCGTYLHTDKLTYRQTEYKLVYGTDVNGTCSDIKSLASLLANIGKYCWRAPKSAGLCNFCASTSETSFQPSRTCFKIRLHIRRLHRLLHG